MNQSGFDFSAPTIQPRTRVCSLPPINGRTRQARHASYTGALHAQEERSANIATLRELWRQPRTINEVSALSGLPISSVCSLKAALGDALRFVDFEVIDWGEGHRTTRRTRWKISEGS